MGLLLLVLVGIAWRDELRRAVVGIIGDELRNDIIAYYSRWTARPTDTADLVPVAHTGMNPYGINVFLEQEVEDWKIRKTLEMIRNAGFGWIKQQLLWSEIEIPQKGQYYDAKVQVADTWAKYDRIVELAQEYGLNLILRLDTSPGWAHPGNPKIETPPDNFDDYGDFVYKVVRRYKGKVKYYQIWNEPNLSFEWGGRQVDAREYVRLLRIAYTRAKEADPDAVIIAAALAPTIENSERALNDLIYLQQMYDAGAKDYFDIMAANPYGLRSGPDDRRLNMEKDVNFSRPILVREVMVRNGDAAKPVWGSEMGWCALPPDFSQEPLFGRVTRDQQARYTVRAYRRIQEEWPWMGVVTLWHFRMVHDVNANQQQYYFNIVGDDFEPLPIYTAMAKLANSPPVVHYGYHQETHWAVNYSGSWEKAENKKAVLGRYVFSIQPGDTITFAFQGTALAPVVAKGPDGGTMRVTIDGAPANLLPRDSAGRAYLDLYSPGPEWQIEVPVARGLSAGLHQVLITVAENPASSGRRVVLDGIIVTSQPAPWYAWWWAMVLGLVAVATVTWGWRRWKRVV